eukprot:215123_1
MLIKSGGCGEWRESWVHVLRSQGGVFFMEIRDTTGAPGLLQCVPEGYMAHCYDALTLAREASVCVFGTLMEDKRARGGVEMRCDHWDIIGGGGYGGYGQQQAGGYSSSGYGAKIGGNSAGG